MDIFGDADELVREYEVAKAQREEARAGAGDLLEDDEDEADGLLGEDDEDPHEDEDYDEDDEPFSDEESEEPTGPPDFFTFGNSLTVKGTLER